MKKKLILPLLIVLAFILTGCTIPIINKEVRLPWEKKPADVIKQAMANSANVKSSHYQSTLKIETEIGGTTPISLNTLIPKLNQSKVLGEEISLLNTNTANTNTNIGGTINLSAKQKVALSISANVDADFNDTQNAKLTSAFNIKLDYSSISLALAGEFRNVNKLAYLKIDTIPNIPLLSQSLPTQLQTAINELQGTWLKIDPQEIQKTFLTSSATPLPTQVALNTNQQEDTYKQFTDLLAKLQPKIQEAFTQATIYSYQSTLPSEKINGVKAYHYKVALDKEGIKQFIIQFIKIYNTEAKGSVIQGLPTNNSINESDLNKQVDSLFKYFNTNEGEIWIGQKDFLTYKMQWHFILKNPDDKNSNQVNLDFDSTFSDFNTPKNISAPDNAKSIIDAYTELVAKATGKTAEELQAQKRDAQRLNDISQIKTALALYADDHEMKYPKTLDELSKNISKVPVNPSPGGVDYTYEPSKDFKSYQLSFILEVGNGGYGPGLHIQTPEGIDKGKDSDSDGLTDAQENYFGTNPNKADTDGDGYTDGEEVKNGYNPNGPGKLELTKYKL